MKVLLTEHYYGREVRRTVEDRHSGGWFLPCTSLVLCLGATMVGAPAGYAQTSATCTTDTTTVPGTSRMSCMGDDDDGNGIDNRVGNTHKELIFTGGTITTTATGQGSRGVDARAGGDGDVTVTNEATGVIDVGGDGVSGIFAETRNGVATVRNAGSVTSRGNSTAIAVYLRNGPMGASFAENTGTILTTGLTGSPGSRPFGMTAYANRGATDRAFDVDGEMITAGVLVINRGRITTNGEYADTMSTLIEGGGGGTAYSINYGTLEASGKGALILHAKSANGNAIAENKAGGLVTGTAVNTGMAVWAINAGNAEATNEEGAMIDIDGTFTAADINTNGRASARARGIYTYTASGTATSNNMGELTVEDDGVVDGVIGGYGPYGVYARAVSGDAEVMNSGTAMVTGQDVINLYALSQDDGDAEVMNSGTLMFGGTNSHGAFARILSDRPGDTAEIVNSGMVIGDGSGAIGLVAESARATGGSANINNEGMVSVRGEQSVALAVTGAGTVGAGKFTVMNAAGAELSATGERSRAAVLVGGSQLTADPNVFTNRGIITGNVEFHTAEIPSGTPGVDPTPAPAAHNMFLNSGEVRGALFFDNGNDIVENSGMIDGNVMLGEGDDTLELMPGSMISGTVDPGAGMDNLMIAGGVTIDASATFFGLFERMDTQATTDAPITLMGVGSTEAAANLSALGIEPIPAPGGVARSTYLFQRQLLNTTIRARSGFDWDRAIGSLNPWAEIVFRTNGAGSGGSRYDVDSMAYVVGVDYKLQRNWDGGFAVGLSSAEADGQIYRENTDLGGGILAIASVAYDNSFWRVELSGGLTYYGDVDTTRPILDPALAGESARGEFAVTQAVAQADVSWQGHKTRYEGWGFVPRVFLAYGRVHEDSYTESGTAAIQNNLASVDEREADFADVGINVGLHWDGRMSNSSTYRFPVAAHVGAVHLLNASVDSVSYQTTATGHFTRATEGLGIGVNRLEAGINVGIAEEQGQWSFSIGYEGEFTSGYEAHSGIAIFNIPLR